MAYMNDLIRRQGNSNPDRRGYQRTPRVKGPIVATKQSLIRRLFGK
jgi:hypothetical protein